MMKNRNLFIIITTGIAVILLLFLSTAIKTETFCSYAGPELSKDLMRLTNFSVSGPSPLREGDIITVKFKLQNLGKSDVRLGAKGIFAAAKDPNNLDASFGFTRANTTLKVGETVTIEVSRILDKAGVWKIWPSYHISGEKVEKFGPHEWRLCSLKVSALPKDSDKDGIPDEKDNCPQNYNPKQEDVDKDGIGDACDPCDDRDFDKDGIKNCFDKCPNEPETFNKYQDEDGCPDTLVEITPKRPEWDFPPITCDSCESCTIMLRGRNREVVLTRDIKNGTCIYFRANNTVFDCQGHKISGLGWGEFSGGIVMINANNNTIKNCIIESFETGISLYSSNNNTFVNNTLTLNKYGIWFGGGRISEETREVIDGSHLNKIYNNTINNNDYGICLSGSRHNVSSNKICRNRVADIYDSPHSISFGNFMNDNVCDLIYNWNSDNDYRWCATICTANISTTVSSASQFNDALRGDYGMVELTRDIEAPKGINVDASHVTIDCNGYKIQGNGSGIGINMENKINVVIKDCVIDNFDTGIRLTSSAYNNITNTSVKNNRYGVIIMGVEPRSRNNILEGNTINFNEVYGVLLGGRGVSNNTLKNNTLGGGKYSLFVVDNCTNNVDTTNRGGHLQKPILYLHDTSGITIRNREYGEVILCNVRNSVLDNISIANGLSKCDGVIVRYSDNVQIKNSVFTNNYEGIFIYESTNIRIENNNIAGNRKNGIRLEFSDRNRVDNNRISANGNGIYLYRSHNNNILNNRPIRGNEKGIFLRDSDHNRMTNNTILNNTKGIYLDGDSENNTLSANTLCVNDEQDIYTLNRRNSGDRNRCNIAYFSDQGTVGCKYCCSLPDSDRDGIGDFCDCDDGIRGFYEHNVDCGGKCPVCANCSNGVRDKMEKGVDCGGLCPNECPKCIPLIKTNPPDYAIEIVFVPDRNYTNMTLFVEHVLDIINNSLYASDPINANRRKINFYYSEDKGTVNVNIIEVEGREERRCDWSFSIPSDCPAGAIGAIIHNNSCRDYYQNKKFSSRYDSYGTFLHEIGHAIFGLKDEYHDPGCWTSYSEQDTHPNIYATNESCQSKSLNPANCHMFTTCHGDWWKSDPDMNEIMRGIGCVGFPRRICPFGPDCLRRIEWVFDQYPDLVVQLP